MVHDDASEADAIARLEAALDRIARHPPNPTRPVPDAAPVTAVVAARLDVLIAQLRDALATGAED